MTGGRGSSSAAVPAVSARPRRRPRSACAPPNAAGGHACSPSTPPGGWARRRARPMGLTSLDNPPRQVDGGQTENGGSLHAMMLDMKRTFDEIVEAHAD